MRYVYQLQAIGLEAMTGSCELRLYNGVVHATQQLAERKVEAFRSAVIEKIDAPTILIVPIEVIETDGQLPPQQRELIKSFPSLA